MKRFIIPSIIAVTVCGLLLYPWKREGFFIDEVGDYKLKGNSHSISVFVDDNQKLNMRIIGPGRKVEWTEGVIYPNKNWFIYVDKINEIWLNYEDEVSFHYSFEDRSGTHSVNLYPNAKFKGASLREIVPDEVISRLSASTLKQLPLHNKASHHNPLPASSSISQDHFNPQLESKLRLR